MGGNPVWWDAGFCGDKSASGVLPAKNRVLPLLLLYALLQKQHQRVKISLQQWLVPFSAAVLAAAASEYNREGARQVRRRKFNTSVPRRSHGLHTSKPRYTI